MTTKTERKAISVISERECKKGFWKRQNATLWTEKLKDSERAILHRKHCKKNSKLSPSTGD